MHTNLAIDEMLSLQATLNDATNGTDWRSGKTKLGKVIDWRRCIFMETAELIDSYPWKHWKSVDAKTDLENVQVELVDIWHFLLSLALVNFEQKDAQTILVEALEQQLELGSGELSALDIIEQVEVHEKMMAIALKKGQVDKLYLTDLTTAFFNACQVAELSFTRLYQIYMAKNVLNKFRQDHGYKEGVYIKMWNGKEDNLVMFEIIETMEAFSADQLYDSLKSAYLKL